jgi:hypothetical protein
MINTYDDKIKEFLNKYLGEIETYFGAQTPPVYCDTLFYYGNIFSGLEIFIKNAVEDLVAKHPAENKPNTLVVILNTPGGYAETIEKAVDIIRFHYENLYFIVPDAAMSAGTIFCMAGDKIFMDYSSSLGPIDPQVQVGDKMIPASGYLDQFKTFVDKSRNGTITPLEFTIAQGQDIALLRTYQQQLELTVTLLKKWLVEYKFKDWVTHATNPTLIGQSVTDQQKVTRAEEIATALGDNSKWHTHGRYINIKTLKDDLRLKIEDYTNTELGKRVRTYNDFVLEHIRRNSLSAFLHTKFYL